LVAVRCSLVVGRWSPRRIRRRPEAFGRQLDAFYRRLDAFCRQLDAFYRQLDAFYRRLDAFYRRLDAFYRRLDAFYRQLDAFHRQLDAFYRQLDAFHRQLDAFHRQPDAFYRQLDAFYRQLDAFYRRLFVREIKHGIAISPRTTRNLITRCKVPRSQGRLGNRHPSDRRGPQGRKPSGFLPRPNREPRTANRELRSAASQAAERRHLRSPMRQRGEPGRTQPFSRGAAAST
jgi:hypothetical protein